MIQYFEEPNGDYLAVDTESKNRQFESLLGSPQLVAWSRTRMLGESLRGAAQTSLAELERVLEIMRDHGLVDIETVGTGISHVDGDTTVVVHNVSGPDTFPRMDVGGRTADFDPGMLEDNVVVEEGKSKYDALPATVERWGDYNGVSVDPSTGTFWTVSQYSPDIDIPVEEEERDPYFTRIAEVTFDGGPGGGDNGGGGGGNGGGSGDSSGGGRGGGRGD